MNWVFAKIFNTHKVLRGDLESLPLFSQYLENISSFNEDVYLSKIKIEKKKNGAYGIKK
jgi:site-specific DNA-methyltransferase (adenine-specific)